MSDNARETAHGPVTISVANAPVSYGAFEVTVGHDPNTPDGTRVLDQVAEAGYAGIDLGPVGYLGTGERLGELLAERGLGLAGAYLELPYADQDALAEALPALDELLDTFDTVQAYLPGPAAAAHPGRRREPGAPQPAVPVRGGSARWAWTATAGAGSPGAWPGWSATAVTGATSPRSTRRPARSWRPPGRSSRCLSAPTSGCAWRRGT